MPTTAKMPTDDDVRALLRRLPPERAIAIALVRTQFIEEARPTLHGAPLHAIEELRRGMSDVLDRLAQEPNECPCETCEIEDRARADIMRLCIAELRAELQRRRPPIRRVAPQADRRDPTGPTEAVESKAASSV